MDTRNTRGDSMDNTQPTQKPTEQATNMIELACRSGALLLDMQLEAARKIWAAQARAASLFGAPDYSPLFASDERARTFFSGATEQMLTVTRQATEAMSDVGQHMGRLCGQQTAAVSDGIRTSLEQLGRDTQQGLEQVRQTVQQGAADAARAGQAATSSIIATGEMGTPPRSFTEGKRGNSRPS
jgi:hypothetical protein